MRLIDADSLKEKFKHGVYENDQLILDFIDEQPTVELTPHGVWIPRKEYNVETFECSKCEFEILKATVDENFFGSLPKRCPKCGAELDLYEGKIFNDHD